MPHLAGSIAKAGRCVAMLLCLAGLPAAAQQEPDASFEYRVEHPAFSGGPRLAVDAGHHNFHTAEGRYAPFARLAAADGFQVRSLAGVIDVGALASVDILVIANALHESNDGHWRLPTPSAFAPGEIAAIRDWVEGGGALLLIADHMPFAGAASDLAAAFGFHFINGYAAEVETRSWLFRLPPDLSAIGDEGLGPIDHVVTFTGQAFTLPPTAHSILTLQGRYVALLPTIAGQFSPETTVVDVSGYSQGAVMVFGKGRLAVFGEAAAFTAQLSNGRRLGMNAEGAEGNAPFVLTMLRWLARYRG